MGEFSIFRLRLQKCPNFPLKDNFSKLYIISIIANLLINFLHTNSKLLEHIREANNMTTNMKNPIASSALLLICLVLVANCLSIIQAQTCNPSGKIRGQKPPPGQCNQENDSDCCKQGKLYTTYKCSPRVTSHTKAVLTLNSFEKGGDGGAPSECDKKYHSDNTPVVALSTGWFNNMERCLQNITIYGNGKSVKAMVVDECDSTAGCDSDHDYQPPCSNNIVDASKAIWKALGVPKSDWGQLDVYWSQS